MINQSKTFEISAIGTVNVSKKKGIRRLSIVLKPNKTIQVNIPYRIGFEEAIHFVNEKKSWILKHLPKIAQYEQKKSNLLSFGEKNTLGRTIIIKESIDNEFKLDKSKGFIIFNIPKALIDEKNENYDKFRNKYIKVLRQEAKEILQERIEFLSKQHNFKYKSLKINSAQTRWGSCSFNNNINLNFQLIFLPEKLCQYVIVHELIHTKVKNHSSIFWDEFKKIYPDALIIRKELKMHPIFHV